MCVGARTFPLLIAVLRSSGMGGGVISGTRGTFPSSTCKRKVNPSLDSTIHNFKTLYFDKTSVMMLKILSPYQLLKCLLNHAFESFK
jgi:hypothetical protein